MTSRRSFLSMILGGAAAAAVAPALSKTAAPAARRVLCRTPFMIWDSVLINPGEVLDEVLFPAPTPDRFLITRMGIAMPAETLVSDMRAVLEQGVFHVSQDSKTVMRGSLYMIPPAPVFHSAHVDLAAPFRTSKTFGLGLSTGEPSRVSTPVTLTVALHGMVEHYA